MHVRAPFGLGRRLKAEAVFLVGLAFMRIRRFDAAARWLREAARLNPANIKAQHYLAWALYHAHHHDEAIAAYRALQTIAPDVVGGYFELGCLLQDAGRHDAAIEAFGNAIAREPRASVFHLRQALSLWALNRLDDAIAALRRATRHDPANVDAWGNLGDALWKTRRWTEVAEVYERLMTLAPSADLAHALSVALRELGRPTEAEKVVHQALARWPSSAVLVRELALTITEQSRFDEALGLLRRLLMSHPASELNTQVALSGVLLEAGRPEEALRAAEDALRIRSDDWTAHAALGHVNLKRGYPGKALDEFREAADLSANQFTELNAWIGTALSALGRHNEAIKAFEEVLQTDPEYYARRVGEDVASYYEASKRAIGSAAP
jgi:tetratricopeptide (TPR) repeat protein